jgi:hypothetical protein
MNSAKQWPPLGEDVTDDTADSSRSAMVGFYKEMIVLDFEDNRKSIAYVNDSGIFTRSLQDLWSSCRQLA